MDNLREIRNWSNEKRQSELIKLVSKLETYKDLDTKESLRLMDKAVVLVLEGLRSVLLELGIDVSALDITEKVLSPSSEVGSKIISRFLQTRDLVLAYKKIKNKKEKIDLKTELKERGMI